MPLADDASDLPLPSLEALVAGTVALMTTWATPCHDARVDSAAQRSLLARKVVSNLFFIQNHPCASAEFRQVMVNAYQRWATLTQDHEATGVGGPNWRRPGPLH
jgi:hypothetical protein